MTPLSFDPQTAREVVGDAPACAIEAKARADADRQAWDAPAVQGQTYWGLVQAQMECIVYREQFDKRTRRNLRKQ